MMPAMIAYSAVHQEFGEAWRHRVMEPSRVCLKRILRRAIKRGLLPGSLDFDAAMALLLGPLLYRHIFHRGDPSASSDFGHVAAESFWRAHSTGGEGVKSGTAHSEQRSKAQRK
jgi:hypothetical protein